MTFAITINIILATIVFIAVVGSLTWAIMASRDGQATEPTRASAASSPTVVGARCLASGPTGKRPARPRDPAADPSACGQTEDQHALRQYPQRDSNPRFPA
jgi:hypothetical protein